MFNVTCYTSTAPENKVNKTHFLTEFGTYSGELIDSTSMLFPSIELDIDVNTAPSFNYIYVQSFGRYYFVKNISSTINGLWKVDCYVDVLMTYKTKIYAQSAYVTRNSTNYDDKIIDDKYPSKPEKTIQKISKTYVSGAGINTFSASSMVGQQWVIVLNGKLIDSANNAVGTQFGSYFLVTTLGEISAFLSDIAMTFSFKNIGEYIKDIYFLPIMDLDNVNVFENLASGYGFDFPGIEYLPGSGTLNKIPFRNGGFWYIMKQPISESNFSFTFRGRDPAYLSSHNYREIILDFPPFGKMPIDSNLFIGNYSDVFTIYFKCKVNMITGKGLLTWGRTEATSYEFRLASTDICVRFPMTAQNVNLTGLVGGVAAMAGAAYIGAAGTFNAGKLLYYSRTSANYDQTLDWAGQEAKKGLYGFGSSIGAGVAVGNSLDQSHTGMEGSASGSFIETPYLYIYDKNIVDENITLYGRPLCKTELLEDMNGYTEISAIQFGDCGGASQDEKDEIVSLLKAGVIFP